MDKKMPDIVSPDRLGRFLTLGEAYSMLLAHDIAEENINFFISEENESARVLVSQEPDAGTDLLPDMKIVIGVNCNFRYEFDENQYKSKVVYALKYGSECEQQTSLLLVEAMLNDLRIQAKTDPDRWLNYVSVFQKYWTSSMASINDIDWFPQDVVRLSELLGDHRKQDIFLEILADPNFIALIFALLSNDFRKSHSVFFYLFLAPKEAYPSSLISSNDALHFLARKEVSRQFTHNDIKIAYLKKYVRDDPSLISPTLLAALKRFRSGAFSIDAYVGLLILQLQLDVRIKELSCRHYTIFYGVDAHPLDRVRLDLIHSFTVPIQFVINYEASSEYLILDMLGSCELDNGLLG